MEGVIGMARIMEECGEEEGAVVLAEGGGYVGEWGGRRCHGCFSFVFVSE